MAEMPITPEESLSAARVLLQRVADKGAPADRDAAAKALAILPPGGQPVTLSTVRDAQGALHQSLVAQAWAALEELASTL